MKAVGKHANRWQSTDYAGPCCRAVIRELGRPTPKLQSSIVQWTSHSPDRTDPLFVGFPRGPALRNVTVHGVNHHWPSLVGLTILDISEIIVRGSKVEDWLAMLSSSPVLEILHMSGIGADWTSEGTPTEGTLVHYIDLPRLLDVWLNNVDLPLASAVIAVVRAPGVASLSFRSDTVGMGGLREMLAKDSTTLFTPALSRASIRNGCTYLKIYAGYACVETFDGDVGLSAEEISDRGAFEFGVAEYESHNAWAFEGLLRFLPLDRSDVPICLQVGSSTPDSAVRFSSRLLSYLPALEELRLHGSAVDAPHILLYLSAPLRTTLGDVGWPCPRLARVHVDNRICSWRVIKKFVKGRFGGREGDRTERQGPSPLKLLRLTGYRPSPKDLASLTCVETIEIV